MKRIVEKHYYGVPGAVKGTIIIDKNGLRVEDIDQENITETDMIVSLITQAINCGDWQHSWSVDVRKARGKNSFERKEIRKILKNKIIQSEQLTQMLKDAKQVLSKWHY